MGIGDIPVPAPDMGTPEPPGLKDAVAKMFGGGLGKPAPPPDPYAISDEEYIKLHQETMRFCELGREPLEWRWWQKLHYFLGNQWIYWNPNTRSFQDKRLAKWIPKPVTNKIDETVHSIMAMLADIEQGAAIRPVGDGVDSQMAAQTADSLVPLLHDEHEMSENFWDMDYWTTLLGDSFLHPHWDKDGGKSTPVNMDQCQDPSCNRVSGPEEIVEAGNGGCPACGGPVGPALGPDGAPITQENKIGKGKSIVVSPLELYLPLYAQKFELVDRLIYMVFRPRHQVEDEVGSDISKNLQWTSSPEYRSLQLYRSLQTFPGAPFTPTAFAGSGVQGNTEGITEGHLWMKPSKKFPRGLYMKFYGEKNPIPARVDGTGPIPTQRLDGTPLWPWVHYPYRRVGGQLYSKSAVDPVMKKQDQLNQVDSMTHLAYNRMGNPVWLEPKGAEVERFTGEPGLVVKYQAIGSNNNKPERVPGEPVNPSSFSLRDQHLSDIEDLTGTRDIIKGAKPSGVEAFSALQLLVERSQSRFTGTFKSRGKAYAKWVDIAIELERRHGPSSRVKNIQGPSGQWSQQIFKRADLTGDIDVRVEDGSTTPKTALGQRAAIEHLSQLGFLNAADPDQQYAVMQKFGTLYLVPNLDIAVKSAFREQDQFKSWVMDGMPGIELLMQYQQFMQTWQPEVVGLDPMSGMPQMSEPPPPPQVSPLVRKPWQDDTVHLQENTKWMNGDDVQELLEMAEQTMPGAGQLLEGLFGSHLQEHSGAIMEAQAAMNPAPAPGGNGAGQGQAMANSNSNSQGGGTNPPPQM